MMIPAWTAAGVLPPGIHWTTWAAIEARYGTTPHRRSLLTGLKDALIHLREVGCRVIYLNGSFVTTKRIPNDYDVIWEWDGVAMTQVDPILLDPFKDRDLQKAVYGGEFFAMQSPATGGRGTMLTYFQTTHEGHSKGILALDLRGEL